ncbi:MAG: 16S rRNA (cytosine(1402)-N(4))-methyltransferase RsmH, partial [Clostridiales bacterium]|nr:16S rRNA (cytosine(1402)-N(4))-methyltransferase RsmH [Clostridiales bacterium]
EKSAFDIVNGYAEKELTRILSTYGEERWAKRIAEFIAAERQRKPIETTFELVSVIKKAVPKGARTDGPHPAKRTFQAIRIEVNGELDILEKAILAMAESLTPGGRLCIITFHSLEDRIVKNTFRTLENPCTCPHDIPVCICGKSQIAKVVTRKPIVPSVDEETQNHRARSAKLRVLERITPR